MHPFERLSAHARQALDLARWHALDASRDEIDADDLTWALLHQTQGGAAVVLARLRAPAEPPPPGWERAGAGKRLGVTARMKDVVRRAYEEAAEAEARHVGSEHLLVGLLECDPGAASVLGVGTADLVRVQVHQWMRVQRFPTGRLFARALPDMSPELNALLRRSAQRATQGQEGSVQLTHVLHEIGAATQLRAAAILLDRLGGPARPPAHAMELLWELEDVQRRKDSARTDGDQDALERFTGEEARLQGEVYRALAAWHAGLRASGGDAPGATAAPH